MRVIFLLCMLVLCPPSLMAEPTSAIEPVFNGFHFGDAPKDDMLCTAGICATGLISSGYNKPHQPVTVYKMPFAATHVEGVEITAPEYSFHQNRLFRVSFKIICPQEMAESSMTRLSDVFNKRYGMTQIGQDFDSSSPGEARLYLNYLTAAGFRVEFKLFQENGQWRQPFVSIYQPNLMETVRLAANPNYRYHSDVN